VVNHTSDQHPWFQAARQAPDEFLDPSNRKILTYLRQYDGGQVLCVANLSRFAQPVDLDSSKVEGMTPVEMLG
jgi:maltose alpha-D-glucosyltransferase/alpha-amylase